MLVAVTGKHAALLHPLTGARLHPVGYRRDGRPIMPILGGAPREDDDFEPDPGAGDDGDAAGGADDDADRDDADDDDRDDTDNDDDTDDDDADGKGKGKGKAPLKPDGKPYTQDDVDKLARSLRAARRTARTKREAGKGTGTGGTDGKGADGKGATEPDEAVVEARAADVAAKTWKPLIVNQAARSALVEAGLIGKPDRLLKLLDPEDIDVDPETGEIDGLDEQIAELRREYRHLFRRTGTRRLDASRDRDGDGRGRGKLTATELQALQLTGRA